MPIYESRGKVYNIPDGKVDDFLSGRSDAKVMKEALDLSQLEGETAAPAGVAPLNAAQKQKGFWKTEAGDILENLGGGALSGLGGIALARDHFDITSPRNVAWLLDKVTGASVAPAKGSEGKELIEKGKEISERGERYGNITDPETGAIRKKTFRDLHKEGDYLGALNEIFLTATRSAPTSLAAMAPGGLAIVGISAAGQKYDEIDSDPELKNMPEWKKWLNASVSGAIEAVTEKVGAKVDAKMIAPFLGKMTEKTVKQILAKGGANGLVQTVTEGLEEVLSQSGENLVDYATGVTEAYDPARGLLEAAIYGAGGGAQFGGVTFGLSGVRAGQTAINNARINREYNSAGKNLDGQLPGDAAELRDYIDKAVGSGDESTVTDLINNTLVDGELTVDQKKSIIEYALASDARRQKSADKKSRSDTAAKNIIKEVESNLNETSGTLMTVTLGTGISAKQVQVTKGIVPNEDGTVNKELSESEFYYRDENGEVQVAPIEMAGNVIENIPRDEAVRQIATPVIESIVADEENENALASQDFKPGDTVYYIDPASGMAVGVELQGVSENGKYTGINDLGDQQEVEPRLVKSEQEFLSSISDEEIETGMDGLNRALTSGALNGNLPERMIDLRSKLENEMNRRHQAAQTQSIAQKISAGNQDWTPEELQYQQNHPGEIEQELKVIAGRQAQEAQKEVNPEDLIRQMEENAEAMPVMELTPENWYAEFGENGVVETPVGEVKMGENQYLKLQAKNRGAEFGMVKPTLTSPDVVIEETSREGSVVNERETNLLFIKTFTDNTGKKYTHFESVTVGKDKKEVVVSNHIIRPQQLLNRLKAGQVVYAATALNASGQTFAEYSSQTEAGAPYNESANRSEMHLPENQNGLPNLVSTQTNSPDKDNTQTPQMQANGPENSQTEPKPDPFINFPRNKKGEIDIENLSAEQQLQYAEQEAGEQFAIEQAARSIRGLEKKRSSLEGKLERETNMARAANIRKEIDGINRSIGSYREYREARNYRETQEEQSVSFADRLRNMEEPASLEDAIAQWIASGGKIKWSDHIKNGAVASRGFGNHLGYSNAERKKYLGITSAQGMTPEQLAHHISENDDYSHLTAGMDTQDILNAVLDVIPQTNTRKAALEYSESIHQDRQGDLAGQQQAFEESRATNGIPESNTDTGSGIAPADERLPFQQTTETFKPLPEKKLKSLVERLKKSGLAKDVIIDGARMREYLERYFGKGGAERFMTLWHGSPHAFDRFLMEYTGTGEGAQVYGHGLYFTEKKKIAEWYAEQNAQRQIFVNGKEIDDYKDEMHTPAGLALFMLRNNGKSAVDELKERTQTELVKRAIHFLENSSIEFREGKNLYEVKIHGDKTADELNFMRYDKPVTDRQKTDFYNRAREEKLPLSPEDWSGKTDIFDNGERLYDKLTRVLGSDKAASEFLLRAGIDGIQYPTDYLSDRSDKGTYNYVVFDENAIEIMDKIRMMSTPRGEIYGFVTPEGVIYLDPDRMNANTPIHEFGHLWNSFVEKNNPELWEKGIELAKQSDLFSQAKNNPSSFGLKENATDREIADEVLARLYGNRGETVFHEKGPGEKLQAWLQDVWKWIGDSLGIRGLTVERMRELSLGQFVDGALADMLSGKAVPESLSGVSRDLGDFETLRALRSLRGNETEGTDGTDGTLGTENSDGMRYQFIGEKGASALDKAEEANIRMDNLSVAREMETAEKDAKAIKFATGWERGADGKWRYEIPDFKVSDIKTWKDGSFSGKLEDLITDADFLKAYPELKGMKADVLDLDFWDRQNEVSDGSYNPRTKEITVKYHRDDPNSAEIMRELLIHEIQHAIQDIEGFAAGGNLRTANEEYRRESNFLSSAVADRERWKGYLEDIKNGGTVTDGNDIATTEKKIAGKNKWIEKQIGKLVELEQAAYNAYESMSGEVEARNASRRRGMTPEERRASLAAETEDVAREDQIFLDGAPGEQAMAEENPEKNATFAENNERTVDGIEIVETPKHDFKNISEAKKWAKENITGTYHNANTGEDISVSRTAIDKYLSEKAVSKSVNLDAHLSALKQLPKLIETSVLRERKQDRDNNENIQEVQRLYGAINYENKNYPVKITVKAYKNEGNKAYSYEVMEIETPTERLELSGHSTSDGIHGDRILSTDGLKPNPDLLSTTDSLPSADIRQSVAEYRSSKSRGKDTNISEKNNGNENIFNNGRIDILAHAENIVRQNEVREAESEVNTRPTEAQKEAGNYKKGHVHINGFNVSIEQPKGSVRSGVDGNGDAWEQTMRNTYGYIRGTEGRDGDQIDVFLGDNLNSGKIFVVDQVDTETLSFDEHKVMMGFDTIEQAREAYLSNYEDGWTGLGDITETDIDTFKRWAGSEGRRMKPFPEYGKGGVRFQLDAGGNEDTGVNREIARQEIDRKVHHIFNKVREGWEDMHLPVRTFFDELRKLGVKISSVNDFYQNVTAVAGKNDFELKAFHNNQGKKMLDSIFALMDAGKSYRDIVNYTFLKHGPERNEYMRKRAVEEFRQKETAKIPAAISAWKAGHPKATREEIDAQTAAEQSLVERRVLKKADSIKDKDYAGVKAVEEEVDVSAQEYTDSFEKDVSPEGSKVMEDFWKNTRSATEFSLNKLVVGGVLSKESADEMKKRWKHYVPLKGHDEKTAEDVYDYLSVMGTYFSSPIKKMHGRTSRADDPFAYIYQMAQSSISTSNINMLKQGLKRIAANQDTKGLMSADNTWYINTGKIDENGRAEWEPQYPEYSPDLAQHEENIRAFNERMGELAAQGMARQSNAKFDIGGLFIKRTQKLEHAVSVFENGKEYTVYINAAPDIARAINGTNRVLPPPLIAKTGELTRWMAANMTSRNPAFIATNFTRDIGQTFSMLPVKEGAAYTAEFTKNIPHAAASLSKYLAGKGDPSGSKYDKYAYEFFANGGKTGFTHILELEKTKKNIDRELKKLGHPNVWTSAMSAADGLLAGLQAGNDFAENLSRLSTYITSREAGRDVHRSISDAKEVTVNFNRKGSGGAWAAQLRPLYLFLNAGIQGLSNFARVAVKHPKAMSAMLAAYASSGVLQGLLFSLMGDDREDEYWRLPDHVRRSNLVLPGIRGFITIPLPQELRAFHGLGDVALMAMTGRKDISSSLIDAIEVLSDAIPFNPMGAQKAGLVNTLSPDIIKPALQAYGNTSWTGAPIYNEWAKKEDPGYQKVRTNKKGEPYAPEWLINSLQGIDHATGGDGTERGAISLNPDKVNHWGKGYFGGLYTMAAQTADIAMKVSGSGSDVRTKDIPFLNRFYQHPDDLRVLPGYVEDNYRAASDKVKEAKRKLKDYEKRELNPEEKMDPLKLARKITENSRIADLFGESLREIERAEAGLRELSGEEQKAEERRIAEMKIKWLEDFGNESSR